MKKHTRKQHVKITDNYLPKGKEFCYFAVE